MFFFPHIFLFSLIIFLLKINFFSPIIRWCSLISFTCFFSFSYFLIFFSYFSYWKLIFFLQLSNDVPWLDLSFTCFFSSYFFLIFLNCFSYWKLIFFLQLSDDVPWLNLSLAFIRSKFCGVIGITWEKIDSLVIQSFIRKESKNIFEKWWKETQEYRRLIIFVGFCADMIGYSPEDVPFLSKGQSPIQFHFTSR